MKLYNRSLLPDEVLYPVLVKAGRLAGARTGSVVVRVNGNWRNRISRGVARRCTLVDKSWLRGKGTSWTVPRIPTDGSMIELWIGFRRGLTDMQRCPTLYDASSAAKRLANQFFATAIHEWKHIADYQDGAQFSKSLAYGRRPSWEDRPEEIRAQATVVNALKEGNGLTLYPELLEPLAHCIETVLVEKHFSC